MTSGGGRAAREARRSRDSKEVVILVRDRAVDEVPWLLSGEPAPKGAHDKLVALRRALGREARTLAETADMSAVLLDLVDGWNAAHPGEEIAPPGAVALLDVAPAAWTAHTLAAMEDARKLKDAFEARWSGLAREGIPEADDAAGLMLVSAMFDSFCLSLRDLAVVARWLADPEASVMDAPDLPPWIDLKHRKRDGKRALRKVSGTDAAGDYALRRLFLAPRTLDLILLHDAAGGARPALSAAARSPAKLAGLLARACNLPGLPRFPRLLKGAALLLQASSSGPDLTMALLAARQMDSFGATPENWAGIFTGPVPGSERAAAYEDPDALLARLRAAPAQGGRTVPAMPAYFQLHAAISPGRSQAADLGTEDRKLTGPVLADRLRSLPWTEATPACLRLLRSWYLHLIETGNFVPASVQRYHSTLGAIYCDLSGDVALGEVDADMLEELYELVLEADERSAGEQVNLRNRLGALHRFARDDPDWSFPEIDPGLLSGEGAVLRVDAELLGRSAIDRARDILRTETGLPAEVARSADAAMLLMSRAGLRIGEATKALWGHFEQAFGPYEDPADATLFIKPSIFGDNKTPAAHRQIRPMQLMTETEAGEFMSYLAWRQGLPSAGPLFGVLRRDGSFVPFSAKALGTVIADCLRRASGLGGASAHSLRRAAATGLFLAIHEARTPNGGAGPFIARLTGWSREDRARAAAEVAPATQSRDAWKALARFLGHSGPGTSFGTYVMAADLAVFEACHRSPLDRDRVAAALAALPRRHLLLTPAVLGAGGERAGIRGEITSPAQALLLALQGVDRGMPSEAAARAHHLSPGWFGDRLETARSLGQLRTSRGKLRLQPPERRGKLAPDPLPAPKLAEALDIADRIIALAADRPATMRTWLATALADASQTNSGTRLKSPRAFREWCELVPELRPADRWQADLVQPMDLPAEELGAWGGIRPREMKMALRMSKTARHPVVRVRLMAPAAVQNQRRAPAESWAGCVRFAAHLAAVQLLGPGELPEPREDGA